MRPGRQVQFQIWAAQRRDSRLSRSGAARMPCSVLVDWFILLSELPTGAGAVNGRAHLFMRRRPFSYAGSKGLESGRAVVDSSQHKHQLWALAPSR